MKWGFKSQLSVSVERSEPSFPLARKTKWKVHISKCFPPSVPLCHEGSGLALLKHFKLKNTFETHLSQWYTFTLNSWKLLSSLYIHQRDKSKKNCFYFLNIKSSIKYGFTNCTCLPGILIRPCGKVLKSCPRLSVRQLLSIPHLYLPGSYHFSGQVWFLADKISSLSLRIVSGHWSPLWQHKAGQEINTPQLP